MRGVEARCLQCMGQRTSADIEHYLLRTCEGIESFLTLMLSSIVAPAHKHIISEAVLRHKHSDGSGVHRDGKNERADDPSGAVSERTDELGGDERDV